MLAIGDITFEWFAPTASEDATPAGQGISSVTIGGSGTRLQIDQLRELLRNFRRRRTVGGVTGILEWVDLGCDSLESWTGWYLLQSMNVSTSLVYIESAESTGPDYGEGTTSVVPFSVSGGFLGNVTSPAPDDDVTVVDGGSP
jgi:hypothetical protein